MKELSSKAGEDWFEIALNTHTPFPSLSPQFFVAKNLFLDRKNNGGHVSPLDPPKLLLCLPPSYFRIQHISKLNSFDNP